jgi:hypothetical protein
MIFLFGMLNSAVVVDVVHFTEVCSASILRVDDTCTINHRVHGNVLQNHTEQRPKKNINIRLILVNIPNILEHFSGAWNLNFYAQDQGTQT